LFVCLFVCLLVSFFRPLFVCWLVCLAIVAVLLLVLLVVLVVVFVRFSFISVAVCCLTFVAHSFSSCSCSRVLLFFFFFVVVVLALVLFRLGCRQRTALVDVDSMLGSRFGDLVCRLDLDLKLFDTRCQGTCRPPLAGEISIKKL